MRCLSKCCFCISLQTGGLVAGAWTLFMAVLLISVQIINIMSMENLTSYQIKHGAIKFKSTKILASLEIALGVVVAFVSLLLLFALMKERRKFLLPYVVGVSLYELFDFSTLMFYVGKHVEIDASVWVPDVVMISINVYCVLIVLSLYNEIKKRERWTAVCDQFDFED